MQIYVYYTPASLSLWQRSPLIGQENVYTFIHCNGTLGMSNFFFLRKPFLANVRVRVQPQQEPKISFNCKRLLHIFKYFIKICRRRGFRRCVRFHCTGNTVQSIITIIIKTAYCYIICLYFIRLYHTTNNNNNNKYYFIPPLVFNLCSR